MTMNETEKPEAEKNLDETTRLPHIKFVVNETPYCFWDLDVHGKNLEFINKILNILITLRICIASRWTVTRSNMRLRLCA